MRQITNLPESTDNVYLNLLLPNINCDTTTDQPKNIIATYDESMTIPVLTNPSEYYASIVRFTMPLDTIPIFSFPVNIQQSNPNVSMMFIGIQTSGGTQYIKYITYVPQNNLTPPTAGGSAPYFDYSQVTSPYYFIYNIQPFLDMINTALSAAYVASGGSSSDSPYYIYNPTTQLISLVVDATFLATGSKIFMNNYLKTYLSSFNFDTQNDAISGAYLFFHNLTTLPYGSPSGGPYVFSEEWVSLALWYDVRKIVITTASLPIVLESSPTFSSYLMFGSKQGQNGTANYFPIFTDYSVTFSSTSEASTLLTYIPEPQYRLCDMKSNSPIIRVQLGFYWLSKNSYLYPLLLSPNQGIEVKIGFFKKSLFKNL